MTEAVAKALQARMFERKDGVWLFPQMVMDDAARAKMTARQRLTSVLSAEGELGMVSVVRKFRTTAAILNRIVSGYFDFAEIQAMRHNPMYMSDYVEHLDRILQSTGEQLLVGQGKVSHEQAMTKARQEYRKFQTKTLTPVETAYLETIKSLSRIAKKKPKKDMGE
jgi:hypothetical protein